MGVLFAVVRTSAVFLAVQSFRLRAGRHRAYSCRELYGLRILVDIGGSVIQLTAAYQHCVLELIGVVVSGKGGNSESGERRTFNT